MNFLLFFSLLLSNLLCSADVRKFEKKRKKLRKKSALINFKFLSNNFLMRTSRNAQRNLWDEFMRAGKKNVLSTGNFR